jgi:hypothetical protein
MAGVGGRHLPLAPRPVPRLLGHLIQGGALTGCWPRGKEPTCPVCHIEKIRDRIARCCSKCRYTPGWHLPRPDIAPATPPTVASPEPLADSLIKALKHQRATVKELAETCRVTPGQALDGLLALRAKGVNVYETGGTWGLEKAPPSGALSEASAYSSHADGSYRFGFISDTHLGSKYARLDVLDDLYRRFDAAKVDRVFHAGNWIEGEASFNRYTLDVHGSEAQLALMVDIEQDPETGAIIACTPTLIHYYDLSYYNDRWKKTGPVVAAERRVA